MRYPVRIEIRASRRLRAALSFAHLVAAGAIVAAQLAPPLTAALLLLLPFSGVRAWRRIGAGRLVLRADGTAQWQPQRGRAGEFRVVAQATALAGLVVVRLRRRDDGATAVLPLAADSTDAGSLRRLRVWLRWYARDAALSADAAGAGR